MTTSMAASRWTCTRTAQVDYLHAILADGDKKLDIVLEQTADNEELVTRLSPPGPQRPRVRSCSHVENHLPGHGTGLTDQAQLEPNNSWNGDRRRPPVPDTNMPRTLLTVLGAGVPRVFGVAARP